MINEIIVRNILSFKEQTQLDLRGTSKTMIVGPNGSGKSNVLHVMEYLQFLVLNLHSGPNSQSLHRYRSNMYSKDEYSELQVALNIDTIEYIVYFKFKLGDTFTIVEEHLQKIEHAETIDIYQCVRCDYINIMGNFSPVELDRIQTYDLDVTSLISIINDESIVLQDKQLSHALYSVFNYFRDKMIFYDYNDSDTAKYIVENPIVKDQIIAFLNECGIHISDLHIREYTEPHLKEYLANNLNSGELSELEYKSTVSKIRHHKKYRLDTIDKKGSMLPYSTESKGTKHLIAVLAILLSSEGAVILIDELDSSLHELLCIKLINMLNKTKRNQIIFTTHLIELMDYRLFSKNEVFTVYKDETDCSKIIQLSAYKYLRSDEEHSWKNGYRMNKILGYADFKVE